MRFLGFAGVLVVFSISERPGLFILPNYFHLGQSKVFSNFREETDGKRIRTLIADLFPPESYFFSVFGDFNKSRTFIGVEKIISQFLHTCSFFLFWFVPMFLFWFQIRQGYSSCCTITNVSARQDMIYSQFIQESNITISWD